MHNMPENFFLHQFTEEFYIKIYVMVNTIYLTKLSSNILEST